MDSAWSQQASFILESSRVPDLLNNEAVAISFHTFVMVRTTSVEVTSGWTVPVILYPTTCGRTMEMAWPSMTASASIPPTPDKNKTTKIRNKTTSNWNGKRSCLKMSSIFAAFVTRLWNAAIVLETSHYWRSEGWRHVTDDFFFASFELYRLYITKVLTTGILSLPFSSWTDCIIQPKL